MITWSNFVSQLFNGLVLGALLALISSGLTIIYGTLGVLNLAHGAMFMLGGYAGWVAFSYTGSFVVAVIAGSLFVMLVGVVVCCSRAALCLTCLRGVPAARDDGLGVAVAGSVPRAAAAGCWFAVLLIMIGAAWLSGHRPASGALATVAARHSRVEAVS